MTISLGRSPAPESHLFKLAEKAVESKDAKTKRRYVRFLLETAEYYAPQIAAEEGTADPVQISRNWLEFTAIDDRQFMDVPVESIDPNDEYSKRIEAHRQALPLTVSLLEKMAS